MTEYRAEGRYGVVAAPHMLAAEAGCDVLADGGNAIEAAVAAAAAIVSAYPHMNHIGGDGFWLIREPSGRVRYIEAAGFAGKLATRERYRELGHETVPERGPLAACTVPGAIGGWMLALEAAKDAGGKMPLKRLLEAAIGIAREGYPVSSSLAWRFLQDRTLAIEAPGFAQTFTPGGKAQPKGARLSSGKLPDTFEQLGRAGLDDFYRGDVGREIASGPGGDRQPGDARRSAKIPRDLARAAHPPGPRRDGLWLSAADAGACDADDPRALRKTGRAAGGSPSNMCTPSWKRPSARSERATGSSPISTG